MNAQEALYEMIVHQEWVRKTSWPIDAEWLMVRHDGRIVMDSSATLYVGDLADKLRSRCAEWEVIPFEPINAAQARKLIGVPIRGKLWAPGQFFIQNHGVWVDENGTTLTPKEMDPCLRHTRLERAVLERGKR